MAKVIVAGQEGRALAEAGKSTTEVFKDEKRPARVAAPPLEMKAGDGAAPPVLDGPGERDAKANNRSDSNGSDKDSGSKAGDTAAEVDRDEGLEPDDKELPERARKRIGKKHYEMKKAQEEAADAERFAEGLFNEREEYRKKVDALEARLREQEAKTASPKPEIKEPNPDDPKYKTDKGEFDWLSFSRETAQYAANKAIEAERAQIAQAQAAKAKEESDKLFAKRLAEATKKYPDWMEVVQKSPVQLDNVGLRFIAKSEYGTDIAYHLAKHSEVAEAINGLGDPDLILAAMGELQTTFKKPASKVEPEKVPAASKTVERQGAPAPITPIQLSGSNPPPVDPAKMDFKQLRAYERERARQRGRR
jgi:hypothetical protein